MRCGAHLFNSLHLRQHRRLRPTAISLSPKPSRAKVLLLLLLLLLLLHKFRALGGRRARRCKLNLLRLSRFECRIPHEKSGNEAHLGLVDLGEE